MDPIADLAAHVARYDAERYPVQHATAQFHLGVALTNAGRIDEAVNALGAAVRLFHGRLEVEQAKAANALGAALRAAGRPEEAHTAFEAAAAAFESARLPAEQGAALFNLGLVRREQGADGESVACFARAEELLAAAGQGAHAAAAARERGAALLVSGDAEEATRALSHAAALAERAGDREGLGAALNGLGLAHLAAGREQEALVALRDAAGCHPRSIRPEAYAMAKANLAVAYERAGVAARARLAARQALAAPLIPQPVADQASAVMERLGDPPGDLAVVILEEPAERRPALVREEVVRWADAGMAERRREAAAWVGAQIAAHGAGIDLCEAWLGALLELPPEAMEDLIRAALAGLAERPTDDRERFRSQVSSAMARFHVPQWMRLKDTFNRLAVELGGQPSYT